MFKSRFWDAPGDKSFHSALRCTELQGLYLSLGSREGASEKALVQVLMSLGPSEEAGICTCI